MAFVVTTVITGGFSDGVTPKRKIKKNNNYEQYYHRSTRISLHLIKIIPSSSTILIFPFFGPSSILGCRPGVRSRV